MKHSGVHVSLGFYPEKAEDSQAQRQNSFTTRQILVPDKENTLFSGRWLARGSHHLPTMPVILLGGRGSTCKPCDVCGLPRNSANTVTQVWMLMGGGDLILPHHKMDEELQSARVFAGALASPSPWLAYCQGDTGHIFQDSGSKVSM